MGSKMQNRPEDFVKISRIRETDSKVSHQYMITPTIFPANLSSTEFLTEENVSNVDTGEAKAEGIW